MKPLIITFYLLVFFGNQALIAQKFEPAELVNVHMGTLSKHSLSNGNTYPAIGLPWGMNIWSAQTGKMGDGWMYQYDADKIRGIKQTHQPSPWMNDYGQFSIMPTTSKIVFNENDRASWYSHKAEIAKPYYYSVYLADHDVTASLTPTERAASFQFIFPNNDSSSVVIDAFDNGSFIQIIPEERKIVGYSTKYSSGHLVNFKNYFVAIFDKDFDYQYTVLNQQLQAKTLTAQGNHTMGIVGFKTIKGEKVHMKIASSFISVEQATLNLQQEIGHQSFNQIKTKAQNVWNQKLSKITVSGGTDEQLKTFYSCLYRTMFFPHKMYEINAQGQSVHYSPYTGKTLAGKRFAGTGFWDTFRALYPFLNLVFPSINQEMQEGLVNDYKEGGWLPEWSSPAYADCMIGNNSSSIVADAYIKGLRGYDIETLYQALIHGANNEHKKNNALGRRGVQYYNSLGFVPNNVGINENVARSLEYAYNDFCIYSLGKALGKPTTEIEPYKQKAFNYKKLFDSTYLLMRPKNKDGQFASNFNPFAWGGAFTEGNSWHYSWSVFQDIDGLIQLMGGNKNFVQMLDSVFTLPPVYNADYYGGIIHEIREMQIMNMGQYAHGNQPIQHMIYLYNYAGAAYKAQYWLREVMQKLYKPTPDGYCGDEDNGQTSVWYVFSALGFYPVTPATNEYVIGTPLFKKATIQLENGQTININANNNNAQNKYIKTLQINSKPYSKNYFTHQQLSSGATLQFNMHNQPVTTRGNLKTDMPYSLSTNKN